MYYKPRQKPSNYTNKDKNLSLEQRRKKAELAGWDEAEMDLEEFEDYFG